MIFCYYIGTLPTIIGQSSVLHTLKLEKNCLSGTLPTEIGQCSTLVSLDIAYNSLYGNYFSVVDLQVDIFL